MKKFLQLDFGTVKEDVLRKHNAHDRGVIDFLDHAKVGEVFAAGNGLIRLPDECPDFSIVEAELVAEEHCVSYFGW